MMTSTKNNKKKVKDLGYGIDQDGFAYIDQREADFIKDMRESGGGTPLEPEKKSMHTKNVMQATKNYMKKKTVSIRMLQRDIKKAKSISMRKGISYQTYLNIIIHKIIEQDYKKPANQIIL